MSILSAKPSAVSGRTGSNMRLIALCVTQLKTQGPARICNESEEEEEEEEEERRQRRGVRSHALPNFALATTDRVWMFTHEDRC